MGRPWESEASVHDERADPRAVSERSRVDIYEPFAIQPSMRPVRPRLAARETSIATHPAPAQTRRDKGWVGAVVPDDDCGIAATAEGATPGVVVSNEMGNTC